MKEYWFNLSDKIRFLFVGAFNAGFAYLLYVLMVLVLGKSMYQTALALSWILSSFVSFTTQKYLVFNVKGNVIKQYLKCCVTWFFSYLINAFLLEIFVKKLSINVILAQLLATFIASIFTYIFFKIFAFKAKG